MKNTISDVDNYKTEYISDLSGIFALNYAFGKSNRNKNSCELLVDILQNKKDSYIKIQKLALILGIDVKDVKLSTDKMREILENKAYEYNISLKNIIDELIEFID